MERLRSQLRGACLDPDASDYNCEAARWHRLRSTGPVRVVGAIRSDSFEMATATPANRGARLRGSVRARWIS